MDTEKINITDLISDLKHEAEKESIRSEARKRHVSFLQTKLNAIPRWIHWVFRKTIWKNIKIN